MSEPKFTPGPWFERGGAVVYGNDDGNGNGDVVADLIESCGTRRPAGELNANAHLMAAAPDMYEACRKALSKLSGSYPEDGDEWGEIAPETLDELCAALRGAIAKAEGAQ